MSKVQPVVICASLNAKWDPEEVAKALGKVIGDVDKDALPVVLGPEFLFASFNDQTRKIVPAAHNDPRLELLGFLKKLSGNALVVPGTLVEKRLLQHYNYAPVFWQGNLLQEVHKGTKGGNTEEAWAKAGLGVGAEHPDTFLLSYFESSETRFGVEICNDIGNMKQFLSTKSMSVWPEVYLMPSFGMATDHIYYCGPKVLGYMSVNKKGQVEYLDKKYVIDLEEVHGTNMDAFGLHRIKPGLVVQSDGPRCRVACKHPMSLRFTLIPPLGSIPIKSAGLMPLDKEFATAVHLFPSFDLNPLKPFWA